MTLDPVHLDGIASLARRIRQDVDDADHRDLAEEAWANFLDPLYDDGDVALEPVDGLARRRAPIAELALQEPRFEPVHGLDSGTINPRTFRNGLVLDIAQAAMSVTPSDLDVQRSRTVVATVHSNDATVDPSGDDWDEFDSGFGRGRIIKAPNVNRYEKAVVHALSLYLAESEHALRHADEVSSFLLLDGPLYPKGILNWHGRAELSDLLTDDDLVRTVLRNYADLVERFVDRDVPLAGFVKNTSSRGLTNRLREKTLAPWANDMAFFRQVLERPVDGAGTGRRGGRNAADRRTDELTWTNWFVSRIGPDAFFAADDRLDLSLDPEAYEVAFFVCYDPRTDLGFKVEMPYALVRDADRRERVERHVLRGVAEGGPPPAVRKADELAHIGRRENASLVRRLEEEFDTRRDRTYDDERWGLEL